MDDPYLEEQIEEAETPSRLHGSWRACLLLLVMLVGLLATPLAVLYRWFDDFRPGEGVNRIAYVTLDHQLATIAPDGRDARRLTEMNRRFEFPAWAPDGSQLAVIASDVVYLVDDQDGSDGQRQIEQVYADSEEPPFYLYWSPDSQYVSFLASHPEGIALHLLDVGGDAPIDAMLAVGQPFYWDWTPAGDRLFIHSGGTGDNPRLDMIDLAGESAGNGFGEPGSFQAPVVSYSGSFHAFAALDETGRSRLVVQDDDGKKRWFDAHLGQLAMAWSPNKELLAYTSPRLNSQAGSGPLRLLDPSSNESSVLSGDNVLAFFWSPDGQTIAYFKLPLNDDGNVRVVEAGDKGRVMARARRQTSQLRLELWAVDVTSGRQQRLALFVPTGVFLRQFLPYFDQYALSHRLWSPDSDSLVIPVIEDGRAQIAVVSRDRGGAKLIADGEIAFWSHQ